MDMLCGLISIPSEVLSDAEIFINFDEESVLKQHMAIFGFNPIHVHSLPDGWVFGHEIHINVGYHEAMCLHQSWKQLHNLFYEKMNLSGIKPINHVFLNKEKGKWSHIRNLDEIIDVAKQMYPGYNWINIPIEKTRNTSEIARIFAETKLLISSGGSLSFNNIFMQPACGLLMYCGSCPVDTGTVATACVLDLWFFASPTPEIETWKIKDPAPRYDPSKFKRDLPYIVYAVYNQSWPADIDKVGKIFYPGDYKEGLRKILLDHNLNSSTIVRYDELDTNNFLIEV
ncbi:hypothetical protein TVAG_316330 [Trichomonas vaginalis G3]|uniref:Glycosyltransferase 61 catalytic domain-containing protein n=1 Tax=Trichomonas vaginalis (strain ATCC PRA-98 / G3) TaxID=412133 RepID=A2FR93_TRIV3|nr:glycosyltransferase family [Trichomonas vaginalis G3]EAX92569.1 hypothetical protein TVAG_316330 [Trichomonas vaginalis G3]KAI5504421.1 glycosyltransferase family [Trichomonas vaginalis G3]|eukprot:XP_001305499.1 hypothetical protein [Trichomonas vaginalis G3]